jgi:hypothetical protein
MENAICTLFVTEKISVYKDINCRILSGKSIWRRTQMHSINTRVAFHTTPISSCSVSLFAFAPFSLCHIIHRGCNIFLCVVLIRVSVINLFAAAGIIRVCGNEQSAAPRPLRARHRAPNQFVAPIKPPISSSCAPRFSLFVLDYFRRNWFFLSVKR